MWFLLENVDMDCSDEESNGKIIASILADSGFETSVLVLNGDMTLNQDSACVV